MGVPVPPKSQRGSAGGVPGGFNCKATGAVGLLVVGPWHGDGPTLAAGNRRAPALWDVSHYRQ